MRYWWGHSEILRSCGRVRLSSEADESGVELCSATVLPFVALLCVRSSGVVFVGADCTIVLIRSAVDEVVTLSMYLKAGRRSTRVLGLLSL